MTRDHLMRRMGRGFRDMPMAAVRFDEAVARAIGQGSFKDQSTASRDVSGQDSHEFALRTSSGTRIR